ncbi:MAG: YtxH domain-containing protein [Deltaproteobacteria bacterium]|nr:YtxH domain-containing protein [Deltaproteobacteria bacterium]
MSTNKGFTFAAFVLGGAVGAGLAFLYAPRSGAETRTKIKEGAKDVTEKAKKLVDERREDLKGAYEAGRDAFVKAKDRLFKEQVQ